MQCGVMIARLRTENRSTVSGRWIILGDAREASYVIGDARKRQVLRIMRITAKEECSKPFVLMRCVMVADEIFPERPIRRDRSQIVKKKGFLSRTISKLADGNGYR